MGQKIKVGERIKSKFSLTGDDSTEKELQKFKRLIYSDVNLKLEINYDVFSSIEDIV